MITANGGRRPPDGSGYGLDAETTAAVSNRRTMNFVNMKVSFVDASDNKTKNATGIRVEDNSKSADSQDMKSTEVEHRVEDEEYAVLPFKIKNAFGLPHVATYPMITLLTVYLFSFYESLGCDPVTSVVFVALARSVDVIVIPYISNYTDSFKSLYGRRRPIVFASSWVYAFFLFALLSPPNNLSAFSLSTWFGVSYMGFFLSSSLLNIPLDALGPELSDNYADRSSIYFISGLYIGLGTLLAIVLPLLIESDLLDFSTIKTVSCSSDVCFSPSGRGQACLKDPDTNALNKYALFDPNTWSSNSCNSFKNVTYNDPADLFNPKICTTDYHNSICLSSFCSCVDNCLRDCKNYNARIAFKCVGGAFACWLILSILYMIYIIKERPSIDTTEIHSTIVPAIVNSFRNRAFLSLLPAWILDSVAFTMIACMMIYFVRYVIQPEYQTKESSGIDCNQGVPILGHESDSWVCKSNNVLGAILLGMLFFAFICCSIWYCLALCIGKKSSWTFKSFLEVATMAAFISVGPGDVYLAIGLGCLAGIPLGAKFLSDALLPDVIDYDELLSGHRNEASYTMFGTLIPKIVAIPAASIPVAILNALGHVQPQMGHIKLQSPRVYHYTWMVTVMVPSILCAISFVIKVKFPLKNQTQNNYIIKGICLHNRGLPAIDPLSKQILICTLYTQKEKRIAYLLDHFWTLEDIEAVKTCVKNEKIDVILAIFLSRVRERIAITLIVNAGLLVGLLFSINQFSNDVLFIFPTLCVIFLGMGILVISLQISRFMAVKELQVLPNGELSMELIDKILEFRKNIAEITEHSKYKIIPTPTEVYHWALKKIHRSIHKFHELFEDKTDDDNDDDGKNPNNKNAKNNKNNSNKNQQRKRTMEQIMRDESSDDESEDGKEKIVGEYSEFESSHSLFFDDDKVENEFAIKTKENEDNLRKELDKLISQTNLEKFLDEHGALNANEMIVGKGIIVKKLSKVEEYYNVYKKKLKLALAKSRDELNYFISNVNLLHSDEAKDLFTEIHNVAIFTESLDLQLYTRPRFNFKDLTVWDHELSSFVVEMIKVNNHLKEAEINSADYFAKLKPSKRKTWISEYSDIKKQEEEKERSWATSTEVNKKVAMNLHLFSPDYNEVVDESTEYVDDDDDDYYSQNNDNNDNNENSDDDDDDNNIMKSIRTRKPNFDNSNAPGYYD